MTNSKNITFDQLRLSISTVKDELDKKPDKTHGTHVTYAYEISELVPGDGSYQGKAENVARGDHVHALPAYPTELKNPHPLHITVNESEILYDGSDSKTIEINHETLNTAPTNHASNTNAYGLSSDTKYGHAMASATVPLAPGSPELGTEISSFARGDHVHPEQINIPGNAETTTKLKTPINIVIGNSSKSFDGSKDMSWTIDDIGAASYDATERATQTEVEDMVNTILGQPPEVNPDSPTEEVQYATDLEVMSVTTTILGTDYTVKSASIEEVRNTVRNILNQGEE